MPNNAGNYKWRELTQKEETHKRHAKLRAEGKKLPTGRPSSLTPETIQKLEEVFSIGASDLEACFYAGISSTTLYNFQQAHPEFLERKKMLKEKPVLKARETVIKNLGNTAVAQWYLEKKKRSEFAKEDPENKVNLTQINVQNVLTNPAVQENLRQLEETIKKQLGYEPTRIAPTED